MQAGIEVSIIEYPSESTTIEHITGLQERSKPQEGKKQCERVKDFLLAKLCGQLCWHCGSCLKNV